MTNFNQRQNDIIKILGSRKQVSVKELSEEFTVSSVTIRTDLGILEEQGLVIRTHGGVELPSSDNLSRRLAQNYAQKSSIAEAALRFVSSGDSILLESGSCVALMARLLGGKRRLTITTNNAFVARQIPKSQDLKVVLIGGVFQQESETMVGGMVKEYLNYFNFDKVFMGVDGIVPEYGVMCRDIERAEVMAEFVDRAGEVILLTDSTKFGRMGLKTFSPLEKITRIVTDSGISDEAKETITKAGVELLIAG